MPQNLSAHQPATQQDNARGIAAMLASMAMFIGNDMFIKLAGETMPLGQAIFLRGLMATTIIVALAWHTGVLAQWRLLLNRLVGLRCIGEAGATIFYLSALFLMPIATATAILQVVPLAVTAGAAVVLGEPVGWRRWIATVVGFSGALIIIRPGPEGIQPAALLALTAVAFIAMRDLSTRRVTREMPTLLLTATAAAAVTCAGPLLGTTEDWVAVGWRELALLAAAALCLNAAYFTIIAAMRTGEISAVGPFRYSMILWALLAGFLVWGDIPDLVTVAGIVIVAGAGIYTFYREARVARQPRSVKPL